MRSQPQPRYSRRRTFHRIWRSFWNLFTTGYVSDSGAYAHHAALDKTSRSTKIRTSRITGHATSRPTVLNKLGSKVVGEVLKDESIIANVVEGEWAGLGTVNGLARVNNRDHLTFV